MKKIRLFLLPLLLLLSGGFNAKAFTTTQQTVLFSGGCPTIGGACPSINLNFQTGKYWVQGVGYVPLATLVSTTRASSKTCANTAGVFTSVGNNILCVTDQGALIEEARTNKSTNYNANPTATTNVTKSGDAAATLTVVDDTAALLAAGLQNIASSGKVYKLDNTAGVAQAFATFSGTTGNTNAHSISTYLRTSGGSAGISLLGTAATVSANAVYSRRTVANVTPSDSLRTLVVTVNAAATVYFILNQLEEGSFVTSPIVIAGASATRAADVPQLIGPALTAALAAKSAFFQTGGSPHSVGNYLLRFGGTATMYFGSATTVQMFNGTTNFLATIGGGATTTANLKTAFGMDATGMSIISNGSTRVTNGGAWAGNTGAAYLGNQAAGDRALNGYMQRFALSPIKGVFDGATAP